MPSYHSDIEMTLWHTYGKPGPPEKISQEAFEGNDRHLRRLVKLRPGERADAADLWEYTQDLRYTPIQISLLVYLLPFCLQAWRDDLRGHGGYGGFVEHFYPVLARPYRWIRALTTYGVLLPDMESLWTIWWSLDTLGRAVAAAQYISCLMYPENENPVFAPWTPNGGGGPPCLWEFEGHLYTHRWLEPNVSYLRGVLNVPRVSNVLLRVFERLMDQPEHEVAALIKEDFPLLTDTVQARCAELPRLLETTQEPSGELAWSS